MSLLSVTPSHYAAGVIHHSLNLHPSPVLFLDRWKSEMEVISKPPKALPYGEELQSKRSSPERASQTSASSGSVLRSTCSSQSQDWAHKHHETRDLAPVIPFPSYPTYNCHTLSEAGGSVWVSSRTILLWRLMCTWLLVFTLGLLAPSGQLYYGWLSTWVYIGVSCTMILATFCSLLYHLYPERSSSITSGQRSFLFLANSTVCMYQVFFSLSAGVDVLYWLVLKENQGVKISRILLHAVNFVLLLVDGLLSLRMVFHFVYAFVTIAIVAAWLIFAWIRYAVTKKWIHHVLDFRAVGRGRAVTVHFIIFLTFFAIALLILLLNRLNRLNFITRRIQSIIADELQMSSASNTTDEENPNDKDLDYILVETRMKSDAGKQLTSAR